MLLCIGFGGKLKVNCPDYERLTGHSELIHIDGERAGRDGLEAATCIEAG
jgi:hypothetical protein